jgi:regulator of telomere elongation helicase 1
MSSSNASSNSSKITINIEGILVDFPYEPYPCQVEYMTKNIIALKFGHNSLLESPTGTGKTLCLLCSTLAWQNSLIKKPKQKIKLEYNSGSSSKSLKNTKEGIKGKDGSNYNGSKIIYASRTHSQLTQVVSELKKTDYKPKLSVLGSREQLCVNTKYNKLKSGSLNHACKTSISNHSCIYKNNVDKSTGNRTNIIRDIEDLKKMGTDEKICSYYFSHDSSKEADLILLPYNYLLDNSIRSTLSIDWSNCIIIFDEAHNLEKIASDAASFSITQAEIATCIEELKSCLKDIQGSSKSNEEDKIESNSGMSMLNKLPDKIITYRILKSLFDIEKRMDSIPLSNSGPGKTKSVVLPGNWLVSTFESCGLNHEQVSLI